MSSCFLEESPNLGCDTSIGLRSEHLRRQRPEESHVLCGCQHTMRASRYLER